MTDQPQDNPPPDEADAGAPPDEADAPDAGAPAPEADTPHPWEAEMDAYPLCDASEDPKWALRIVWVWVFFTVFNIVGIVALLILGIYYD